MVEAARSAAEDHTSLHTGFSSLAFSSYSVGSSLFPFTKMHVLSGPVLIQVYRRAGNFLGSFGEPLGPPLDVFLALLGVSWDFVLHFRCLGLDWSSFGRVLVPRG